METTKESLYVHNDVKRVKGREQNSYNKAMLNTKKLQENIKFVSQC